MANRPVIAAIPRPSAPAVEAHEGLLLRNFLSHSFGIGIKVGIVSVLEECSLSGNDAVLLPSVVVCLRLVLVCLRCVGFSWNVVSREPMLVDPPLAAMPTTLDDVVVVLSLMKLVVVPWVVVELVVVVRVAVGLVVMAWVVLELVVMVLVVVELVVVVLVVIMYGPAQCILPSWCGSFPK